MAGSDLKINTLSVSQAAGRIDEHNNAINSEFSDLQKTVDALYRSWEGNAASGMQQKFNSMKRSYFEDRSHVVQNFTKVMRDVIGEGYVITENANKSLADQFK